MATANIRITADTSQALSGIRRIETSLGGIQRSSLLASRAVGALVGALSVGAIIGFSDTITSLRNRLNQLSDSQQDVNNQFRAVAGIALASRQPIEQVGDLYFRIARNAEALGISQREAAEITQSVAKAISASGMSAQEAAGPLLQLGQALQSGRFQGDELRSILEGLPPVSRALANSLGVPIGALKELGSQGRITSADFVRAMREAKDSIERDFARTIPTVSQAFNQLRTAAAVAYDQFEQNTQVGQSLARTIQILAGAILLAADNVDAWIPTLKLAAQVIAVLAGATIMGKLISSVIAFAGAVRIAMMTLGGWLSILLKIAAAVGAYIGIEMFADSLDATGEGAGFAEDALRRLSEAQTQYLNGLNDVSAAAPAAYDGKLIENQRKALEGRNKAFSDALSDLQQGVMLAGLQGDELEVQSRLYQINKNLVKEIKNDKGEIVGYTEGLTDAERQQLAVLIEQARALEVQKALGSELQAAMLEESRLGIYNLNLREQQAAVDSKRLELGRALTAEEEAQVRAIVQKNQANRETLAIDEARRKLAGDLTRIEAIQRGTSIRQRLDAAKAAQVEYTMDMEALKSHLDAKLISEEEYQRQVMLLKKEYARKGNELYIQQVENENRSRQTAIQAEQMRLGKTTEQAKTYAEFMMKTEAEKAQFAIQQGAEIFNALGAQNKKAFEAAKAFNIANAIMNTYMAVTKALASYPPPFNFLAAGAALTFGLAQVAQIRSQQYSGRSLGGPVMGNTPYIVGENGPELFTPATTGRITRNSDLGGSNVTVNFNIQAVDAEGVDDILLQRRGLITQMISDAMNERGQRSMI